MKYFFPDSQDLIDPSFNFETESRAEFRVRQRDDLYAHEVLSLPPFDGLLVSKAIVDGAGASSGKYTMAQRHRLLRLGVRKFLRADNHRGPHPLQIMGDCGAFTYKDEERPPFSVEEVVQFYDDIGFDLGISVDHVILAFSPDWDSPSEIDSVPPEIRARQDLTLALADEFLHLSAKGKVGFAPIGVAQGWSPKSYAYAVSELQKMGYTYIAVGGMVPLKTVDILLTLSAISEVRRPDTKLHMLGVTRVDEFRQFRGFGVVSFDSTSPFLQAFKDEKANYHTATRSYSAVRVPQVEASPKMARLVRSGRVDQERAKYLERECLQRLRSFDADRVPLNDVLEVLREYEGLHACDLSRMGRYRDVLEDRPWKACGCQICGTIGVDVVIFRGSERNKRRGFHNLTVFREKLSAEAACHRN